MNSSDNASPLLCGDAAELLCSLQLGTLLSNSSNRNEVAIYLQVNEGKNHAAIEAGTLLTGTVGIKHVLTDDSDENGMVESDQQNEVMSFQLIMEGCENTVVVDDNGEYSYSVSGKHTFLHKAYDLKSASNTKSIENDGNFPFSIHLPKDMPTSMPRFVWGGGFSGKRGDCRISYQVTATIIMQGSSKEALLFKSLSIPLRISAKRRECSPSMQLLVGPMLSYPVTTLCGLYTTSNLESFSLKTNRNSPILLRPGQQLQIGIEDRDGIWRKRVSKTVWKLTQRIKWTAKNKGHSPVEVPHQFKHWEQELASVSRGCVDIPEPKEHLRMTYEGRLIQVYHEIIVFSCNKESNVLATSQQIPVIISPGYATEPGAD